LQDTTQEVPAQALRVVSGSPETTASASSTSHALNTLTAVAQANNTSGVDGPVDCASDDSSVVFIEHRQGPPTPANGKTTTTTGRANKVTTANGAANSTVKSSDSSSVKRKLESLQVASGSENAPPTKKKTNAL